MIQIMKQIEAPRMPIIFSNSGKTIAKPTNMALTPTLIRNLVVVVIHPPILEPINDDVEGDEPPASALATPNNTSNAEIMGFAFKGVLAKGMIQINPLIKG